MADFIDEIMGFDPTNLDVFKEKSTKQDPNIYRTNPKDSKSDDGNYRAKIKLILNPFAPKDSIIPQAQYWLKSLDGSMPVRSSLSVGDKNCPIFKAWKRQWFAVNTPGPEQDAKRNFAKANFSKNESQWVLVQILEDENKPELNGQFRVMKLAKDIYEKLVALMNPAPGSSKRPYPVMDYVIGLVLELDVKPGPDDPQNPERKQREISYSICKFGDYATVIKTDGTPLLSEEEMEIVDSYVTASKDSVEGKTDKKRKEAVAKLDEVRPAMRPIYTKVVEYVRENVKDAVTGEPLDIVKYCGYQPWDEQTTEFVNRWIEIVDAGISPETISYDQFKKNQAAPQMFEQQPVYQTPVVEQQAPVQPSEDDGLPF